MKKTLAVIAIILTIITTFVGCGNQQLGTVTMAGNSSEVIIDDGDAKEAMAEIDEDEKDRISYKIAMKYMDIAANRNGDIRIAMAHVPGNTFSRAIVDYYDNGDTRTFEVWDWDYSVDDLVMIGSISSKKGSMICYDPGDDNKVIYYNAYTGDVSSVSISSGKLDVVKFSNVSIDTINKCDQFDWKLGYDILAG